MRRLERVWLPTRVGWTDRGRKDVLVPVEELPVELDFVESLHF